VAKPLEPKTINDGFKGFIIPKKLGGDFGIIDVNKIWGSWKVGNK